MRIFEQTATEHKHILKAQSARFAKLTQTLTSRNHDMRSAFSYVNEKDQQHRMSENTKLIVYIDKTGELQDRLAAVQQDMSNVHLEQWQKVVNNTNERRRTLYETHTMLKKSLGAMSSMVEVIEQTTQQTVSLKETKLTTD